MDTLPDRYLCAVKLLRAGIYGAKLQHKMGDTPLIHKANEDFQYYINAGCHFSANAESKKIIKKIEDAIQVTNNLENVNPDLFTDLAMSEYGPIELIINSKKHKR